MASSLVLVWTQNDTQSTIPRSVMETAQHRAETRASPTRSPRSHRAHIVGIWIGILFEDAVGPLLLKPLLQTRCCYDITTHLKEDSRKGSNRGALRPLRRCLPPHSLCRSLRFNLCSGKKACHVHLCKLRGRYNFFFPVQRLHGFRQVVSQVCTCCCMNW